MNSIRVNSAKSVNSIKPVNSIEPANIIEPANSIEPVNSIESNNNITRKPFTATRRGKEIEKLVSRQIILTAQWVIRLLVLKFTQNIPQRVVIDETLCWFTSLLWLPLKCSSGHTHCHLIFLKAIHSCKFTIVAYNHSFGFFSVQKRTQRSKNMKKRIRVDEQNQVMEWAEGDG